MPSIDPSPDGSETDANHTKPANASFLQVVGAVFWSFFGVRKGTAMSRDAVTIKPLHVILAGVALAAIFVVLLITLVRFITHAA